jgi:GTPase SAR1 family protein
MYREANVLLLVFDLNYKRTFEELDSWCDEARDYGFAGGVRIVVGNKSDQLRILPEEATKGWATSKGCLYAETSASTGKGIDELRDLIIKTTK